MTGQPVESIMSQVESRKVYAIAESVPDHIGYLTAGKRYEVLHDEPGLAFDFEVDGGKVVTATWCNSTHLDGGNWTRIEDPTPIATGLPSETVTPAPAGEDEGQASAEALAILAEIDDAYASYMGDPEGNDDTDTAKNAAALIIDRILASRTTESETVTALREALEKIANGKEPGRYVGLQGCRATARAALNAEQANG